MQFFKILKIIKDFFDDGVNDIIRHFGRGHESGLDAEGGDILVIYRTGIELRYPGDGLGVIGVFGQQAVHLFDGNELDLAHTGSGFLVVATGMSDRIKSGIDAAVLNQSGRFGGLEAFGIEILFPVQSVGLQGIDGILAVTGTDVTDVDAFAPEIIYAVDVGIHRGDQVNRFRVDGENRPQILLGAFVFPVFDSFDRLVLAIGLGHPEFQITGHNRVDVKHGSAGGFHRGADAVFLAFCIYHPCNGTAGGVINTGNSARADGDEGCFGFNLGFKRS